MRFRREIDIKTLCDLANYIYWEVGVIDMEDVRRLIDLMIKYKHLLKQADAS